MQTALKLFLFYREKWKQLKGIHRFLFIASAITIILTLRKLYDIIYRKIHKYPPGPCGVPLFGSLFWMNNQEYIRYLNKYYNSSILLLNFGQTPCIMINDLSLVRKQFALQQFMNHNFHILAKNKSLTLLNGEEYKNRRHLLQSSFITVLDSKYLNKNLINMFENTLYPLFDKRVKSNSVVFLHPDFCYSIFTMLFTIIFGAKFNEIPLRESTEYLQFFVNIQTYTNGFTLVSKLSSAPIGFLSYLIKPFLYPFTSKIANAKSKYMDIVEIWTNKYFNDDQNDDNNNRVSTLQTMIADYKKGNISKQEIISDIQLLFVGGIDATSKVLVFGTFWLSLYPDLQQKIYKELLDFKKKHNDEYKLQSDTNLSLHLLRAFIHECLRVQSRNGALEGLPRAILTDNIQIKCNDNITYNLPKNGFVLGCYAMNNDNEKYWKNHNNFDIHNFLDNDGKFKRNKAFSTFGIGPRSCAGKAVALRELYLMYGLLILRYQFVAFQKIDQQQAYKYLPHENILETDPTPYKLKIKLR